MWQIKTGATAQVREATLNDLVGLSPDSLLCKENQI
jgi:hypothetical protein